jgi:hypothetical protein
MLSIRIKTNINSPSTPKDSYVKPKFRLKMEKNINKPENNLVFQRVAFRAQNTVNDCKPKFKRPLYKMR